MKQVSAIGIILASLAVSASAQEFKRTATTGFVFLEIPVSARSAALGEASVALSDVGAEGVFVNPGAVGFSPRQHSVSFSYSPWFAEIAHYAASYAYNSPIGVVAVSAVVMDYGTMDRFVRIPGSRSFESSGTFSAQSAAFGLTYSRQLTDRFSFGVSLKYVNETIDAYKASNMVFDGGILYYTGFSSLRLAAAIQNFGTDAKFINDAFKMPAMLRLGAAMEIVGDKDAETRLTALVDALHPSDATERINVGLELAWMRMLVLRGGYKFLYDEESYSVGLGWYGRESLGLPVGISFAYSSYGRLGNILRFSLEAGLE
jgi:hypothetical protein